MFAFVPFVGFMPLLIWTCKLSSIPYIKISPYILLLFHHHKIWSGWKLAFHDWSGNHIKCKTHFPCIQNRAIWYNVQSLHIYCALLWMSGYVWVGVVVAWCESRSSMSQMCSWWRILVCIVSERCFQSLKRSSSKRSWSERWCRSRGPTSASQRPSTEMSSSFATGVRERHSLKHLKLHGLIQN